MATLRLLDRFERADRGASRPLPTAVAPDEDSSPPAGGPSAARATFYVALVLLFAGAWLSLRLSVDDTATLESPESARGGGRLLVGLAREPLTANAGSPREIRDLFRVAVGRAKAALAEDDFAEAILEYHEALLLDPRNAEALEGLRLAGARYRERKRLIEVLAPAERAFAGGDFSLALQILHRLPPTKDPEFVRRCIASTWYNLGMASLRAGDPDAAAGRFEEALASVPSDERTLRARELARRSRGAARDERYLAELERLGFRRWEE